MLENLSDIELGKLRKYIRQSPNIAILDKQNLEINAFAKITGTMPKRIRELENGILIEPLKSSIRKKYEAELLKTIKKIEPDLRKSRSYKHLFVPKVAPLAPPVAPLPSPEQPSPTPKPKVKVNERNSSKNSGQAFDIQIEKTVLSVKPGDKITIQVLPDKVLKINWNRD